ncbi:hypothetical protein DERF_002398 [Dermatophagoides farinae]|uniref:Uncharacterized protein n=1 Tax=Dermatophagoides farinae TaxID=6954 RepID=A0A922IBH3_DERFA|nr:uncharacterized protein LOC124498190 [Dermatophagoides farinae]KAH7636375.1 hypothetical protein HUG17_10345 [Dermatophagoides farinae]KAH9528451.1 hypothetical protein DERF_002398 [Dermatophagoides farinae]
MCRYHGNENQYSQQSSSSSPSSLPRILQALIRMERKAENDYHLIQSRLGQIKEMESILNKLIVTHIDSDNYVDYLFKRAEQLSGHLETYENIIGKIDIGEPIRKNFKQISFEFIEYLKRKIEFKSVWIESMERIEMGRQTIKEKVMKLDDFKQTIDDAYENGEYFRLSEQKTEFDQQLDQMNNLVDNCFQSGQQSKELSSILHDKLTELESNFQHIVRESMDKINDIKRTSARITTC